MLCWLSAETRCSCDDWIAVCAKLEKVSDSADKKEMTFIWEDFLALCKPENLVQCYQEIIFIKLILENEIFRLIEIFQIYFYLINPK